MDNLFLLWLFSRFPEYSECPVVIEYSKHLILYNEYILSEVAENQFVFKWNHYIIVKLLLDFALHMEYREGKRNPLLKKRNVIYDPPVRDNH